MIKTRSIPISKEITLKPLKLYLFILKEIYTVFAKSVVGSVLIGLLLINIVLAIYLNGKIFVPVTFYFVGITILFPMTGALEEFFHAVTCIARGKKDTIKNLLIGYYEKKGINISLLFAAVNYLGKFSQIDKLYLSAGGPVVTFVITFTFFITALITQANIHVTLILLLNASMPLTGLFPNKTIMESDGYNIIESAKKLRMPKRKIPVEMLKTICFAIQVLKSPGREFKDNYVDAAEILKKIETLLEEQEIQKAIRCYEKLLLIEPYNGDFLNNIAWLHYELGLLNQALLFSRKAVKMSPADKDYLDTFAKIKSALKSTSSLPG